MGGNAIAKLGEEILKDPVGFAAKPGTSTADLMPTLGSAMEDGAMSLGIEAAGAIEDVSDAAKAEVEKAAAETAAAAEAERLAAEAEALANDAGEVIENGVKCIGKALGF